jgi:hypothetical protein
MDLVYSEGSSTTERLERLTWMSSPEMLAEERVETTDLDLWIAGRELPAWVGVSVALGRETVFSRPEAGAEALVAVLAAKQPQN